MPISRRPSAITRSCFGVTPHTRHACVIMCSDCRKSRLYRLTLGAPVTSKISPATPLYNLMRFFLSRFRGPAFPPAVAGGRTAEQFLADRVVHQQGRLWDRSAGHRDPAEQGADRRFAQGTQLILATYTLSRCARGLVACRSMLYM